MQLGDHANSLGTPEILAARGPRNAVDPRRPYAFLVEREFAACGRVEEVATIFLTNRECPFRCLMCDLWKNTTPERVPAGAIPEQIDYALSRLPPAQHIKPPVPNDRQQHVTLGHLLIQVLHEINTFGNRIDIEHHGFLPVMRRQLIVNRLSGVSTVVASVRNEDFRHRLSRPAGDSLLCDCMLQELNDD